MFIKGTNLVRFYYRRNKKNYVPERIDKRQLRNGNVQKSKMGLKNTEKNYDIR